MFWPSTWILSIWKGHYAYFFHKLYIRINICVRVLHETTRYLTYLSMYLFIYLSIYLIYLSISLTLSYFILPYLSLPYLLSAPSMPYLILSTYLSIMFYLSTSLSTCKSIHMEWTCWTLRKGKITKKWFPRATPAPPTNKNIRINQNHIKYVFV